MPMKDSLSDQVLGRIQAAENYLATKRDLWTEYENIFHSILNDSLSGTTKSQVYDNKLGTFILEREYRVMAQLMVGKIKAMSKNDEGASKLMNLIMDKYVIPNANAQFDFLTKCRMMDRYSNIYGNFFALIDWDIKKNGYIGPDMWLLNIRDVFPQVGAVSVEDSDYITIRTWHPKSFFKSLGKREGYKNVGKINEKLEMLDGDKDSKEAEDISSREDNQYPNFASAKQAGYFQVYTQYEGDRWVSYVPTAHEILRDTSNPHDNGELPVVAKYSIPLLDDFMGFGDFERGKTMQYMINSMWNLYLDSQKMSIFPPIAIDKDKIASMSSIKYGPAAKWLVRGGVNNVVAPLNLTGNSMATFNNAYNVGSGALLNMFGTTTTQTTAEVNPEFGRTPEALKQQSARENSRDNADRYYMEKFLTSVMKKMTNLVAKKQSSALTVRMFKPEIEDLARSFPEIKEMYDEKSGKLTIKKSNIGSILYDYEIVPGSTYMVDQAKQQEAMNMMLEMFMKSQSPQGNIIQQLLQQDGYEFKFGELFKRMFSKAGIEGFDKIIIEKTDEEQVAGVLDQDQQRFQDMIMQMGVNQVPPMEGGMQPNQQMQIPNEGGMNENSNQNGLLSGIS